MLKRIAARVLARRRADPATAAKPGATPRARGGVVQSSLAGHSALGLGLGALVYIVCLSGAVAVFADDLSRWEWAGTPETATLAPEVVDQALAAGLARAAQQAGGAEKVTGLYGLLPRPDWPHLAVRAFTPAGAVTWRAGADGVLADTPSDAWTDFIGEVHMELSLPGVWAGLAVGTVGIVLLSLLFSGILAHPRIFRDAFALRLTGARRLGLADLHNRLSVWGLPFHVAITVTGALFALASLMILTVAQVGYKGDLARAYAPLSGAQVAADAGPQPLPPIALLQAQVADPTTGAARISRFYYVERPGTKGQRILLDMTRHDGLTQGDRNYFDGEGKLLAPLGFLDGPVGMRVYGASLALHCATYGGLPVRLVYGVLGLALSIVTATGFSIFLARRRDRGRPLPRLERAWAGVTWGVPLAATVSAAFTLAPDLAREAVYLWSFWGLVAILPLLSLAAPTGERASRTLRLLLGAALVLLAGAHAARHGTDLPAAALVVDLVLALAGVGFVFSTGLAGRRARTLAAQANPAP
ncbi:PepSY-associated TM helix domain-containing protein [Nitrospirillum amazonense]|uniref:Putative iron-regulated membrane protein n=1 Tax=Nitrospirillum amazonense TaxID=28077 RepID=A0A560KA20_9PROT|nr:PepSY-associated TM helix domain-containing protein [Nitrospirillum amazonense]MDG3441427.1 PepSY-associated TM helix domain-containing protein [Nitrospirillum amazonense]TWB80082.1 putative iron-regulated membrane protein [Nitrospirillum amazonense]